MTDVAAYLRRIGLAGFHAEHNRNDAAALATLHRAHLETVPYENLDIQLRRPISLRPTDILDKIVRRRRGGYCYELNGGFALLLRDLGFRVRIIEAAIQRATLGERAWGNHMALLVEADGQQWLADVGLGDGFLAPLPLREGIHIQGPFPFGLSEQNGVWRMAHHPGGAVDSFEFRLTPRSLSHFTAHHIRLSTSPDSPFTRLLIAQRPGEDYTLTLHGLTLTLHAAGGAQYIRTLRHEAEFTEVLADEFNVALEDVGAEGLHQLWRQACEQHLLWTAA